MGEDWERKTQKAYKRLLQESQGHLRPAPLYLAAEEETTLYPCQLMNTEPAISAGQRLTLFRHSGQARIAVLDGNRVIGSVGGEAARDLRKLLDSHRRRAPGAIAVEVASSTAGSVHFEVKVIGKTPRPSRKGRDG
jgi:hypothetical protein